MVEVVDIILLGNIVQFDVSELAIIDHIRICDAAVQEGACDVRVVWFVWCAELVGVVIQPISSCSCGGFLVK